VVDVEVDNWGLDTESEYAGDLLIVPVLCSMGGLNFGKPDGISPTVTM
jgi:hypothetical protein